MTKSHLQQPLSSGWSDKCDAIFPFPVAWKSSPNVHVLIYGKMFSRARARTAKTKP